MTMPAKLLSKSKFSMYLRTQCDKELYLSLFKDKGECQAAGIPVPLKSRPGVQLITKSGQEFEIEQFDQLIRAIPSNVIHQANGKAPTDLLASLALARPDYFILQPEIEPETFRDTALDNIGVALGDKQLIPRLAGLKPDALFIHVKGENDFEILPDGSRKALSNDDSRLGISVIDLKNVAEGNASYSAEVCLYAFFLSNWLATDGSSFKDKFFVSDKIYLWKHSEMPEFNRALGLVTASGPADRVSALLKDLQEGLVDYLIYMPSVTKFLKEDVPRVVKIGDTEGWQSLKYHVNPRCGACDYLGNTDWLNPDDRALYDANPTHYCIAAALQADHLCKMPALSKGATEILSQGGHQTVTHLVGILPNSVVLKRHAFLKRDKSQIGSRAEALTNGTITIDTQNKVAGLAKYLNAEFDIVVNFDAGSGFLTGLGLRGILFPPPSKDFLQQDGSIKRSHSFGEQAFVVPKDTLNAEWASLRSFIETLSAWITKSEEIFETNSNARSEPPWGSIHVQISFWEQRQYEELCNAFSRHLLKVLSLPDRQQRALAWLFPADELMEKDEQIAPAIIFIRDIVDLALRLPVRFANTLLGVMEYYHLDAMQPRSIDRYHRELLGNAIPRERIFEIWKSTTGTVKSYGREITITEAIQKYGDVLKAHSWALASITGKLRADLRASLHGSAPAMNLSILNGTTGVAYDSKLWLQWERVNSATAETESTAALITNVERLEASYKVILLTQLLRNLGNNRFEFEVSEESTESKLEEGAYFVLGVPNQPGYPLLTPIKVGLNPPTPQDTGVYRTPFHKIIAVAIESFDRANRKAVIELRPRRGYLTNIFDLLMSRGHIPIVTEAVYILDSPSPNFFEDTLRVLRRIGNPSFATAAPEALAAMGASASRRITRGADPSTPAAEILWRANRLATTTVRTTTEANDLANYAETANVNPLNASQKDAVRACANNKLSVIWGPPGTGKTDTLVALIHSAVHESQTKNKSRKILITGPNYRAVEELIFRLIENINNDSSCRADLFMVYSRSRAAKVLPSISSHLNAFSFSLDSADPQSAALKDSLGNADKVTIVATTVHQIIKITDYLFGMGADPVQGIYDLVIIDESSQVEMVRAIQPMAVLRPTGQLVVAGDQLQMPPITHLEPPKNAEYLVGSIQTYLIHRFQIQTRPLLVNYRSNQDLVDYAKTIGYPQTLTASNRTKKLKEVTSLSSVIATLPAGLPQTRAYHELLVPDRTVTALIHDDVVSSQANEMEAKLVAALAFCIRNSMASSLETGASGTTFANFNDNDFFEFGLGVVTPHKAQKALVIKELRAIFPAADPRIIYEAVDTVERFQGGQRQTIIISFGVGDIDIIEGEEAFLLQKERTNVAVSRAEAKCILLMPKTLAYHLPSDQEAASTSRAIKSYMEEFCKQRLPVQIEKDGSIYSAEVRWH